MPKLKSKSAAAPAAQTRDEAERLVARIGEIQRELVRREADLGDRVAALKAEAETGAQPLKHELAAAHEAVQGWSEANRQELTRGGRTKTVELGTGKVLWRLRPPSVRIRDAASAIAYVRERPWLFPFVRTKHEINREALIAAPETARTIPGVSIGSAGEDFAIEPFEAQLVEAAS